jgi:hypothetical protein
LKQNNGLLIQGTVVNNSSQVLSIPAMQGTLKDANGQDLRRWVFNPPVRQLAPGQRTVFQDRSAASAARRRARQRRLRRSDDDVAATSKGPMAAPAASARRSGTRDAGPFRGSTAWRTASGTCSNYTE